MKKPVLLLLAGSLTSLSLAQNAQMVFNVTAGGQPYLVWNPSAVTNAASPFYNAGAYLVLDNPNANALWYQPSNTINNGGAVPAIMKTEAAQNKIRWAIGTTVATYTLPYSNEVQTAMPLEVNKTGAGIGAGSFVFSTYSQWSNSSARAWAAGLTTPTTAGLNEWDNRNYMAPAGVAHMNDFFLGTPDNSFNAVNRFWTIDVTEPGSWTTYGAKPPVTLKFTDPYVDIDVVGGAGNQDVIAPGPGVGATPLQAQRFNPGANLWGDYTSAPTSVYTALGTGGEVSNVVVTAGDFFKAWTLSSVDNPLPIELTSWNGECKGGKVELSWTTATETNSDYFTIEKSATGDQWEEIGRVEAAGNSTSELTYTYYDEYADGLSYYRLSQTDANGRVSMFSTVAAGCSADNTEIVNAWDDGSELQVVVSSTLSNVYDVILTDAQGKVMVNRPSQAINKGFTPLRLSKNGIATGLYVVTLQNANDVMTRRVFLH